MFCGGYVGNGGSAHSQHFLRYHKASRLGRNRVEAVRTLRQPTLWFQQGLEAARSLCYSHTFAQGHDSVTVSVEGDIEMGVSKEWRQCALFAIPTPLERRYGRSEIPESGGSARSHCIALLFCAYRWIAGF